MIYATFPIINKSLIRISQSMQNVVKRVMRKDEEMMNRTKTPSLSIHTSVQE